MTMDAIYQNKFCGKCHNGQSAFGSSECQRCHK
jgi:c(7)-type cytochrome triheme protein